MWPLCQQQAAAVDHASVASYLDFLSDDLIVGSHNPLDAGTLAAVAAAQGPVTDGKQRKRMKRDASVSDAAAFGGDAGSNEEDLSDEDEDEPKSKGSGKRKHSMAAQNKANREKARREKINDRHVWLLCALLLKQHPDSALTPRQCTDTPSVAPSLQVHGAGQAG